MNSIGHLFRLTTFGESHGIAIGGIIDGFPAGVKIDLNFIQSQLDRRKPGQSKITTSRKENDEIEILSGVFNNISTGTPIGFIIKNSNQHSQDYNNIAEIYRPSHADFTYEKKYGIRDHRGGGRSSARETAVRVAAGGFAELVLQHYDIKITAYTSAIGSIKLNDPSVKEHFNFIESNDVRTTLPETALAMENLISKIKKEGDTIGGIVSCNIQNCPIGLGEPIYNKLHADLGAAMLSINAAKGFDFGDGFQMSECKGSEINDIFYSNHHNIKTLTNHSGGIQGGISNGEDINFRVAFKPVATLLKPIKTVKKDGTPIEIEIKGRHDPCVVPRAVPIVEAMARIVILDHLLLQKTTKL